MPGSRPGDLQPIRIQDLRAFGVGGQNQAQAVAAALAGFQFHEQGLMLAGEVLGAGTWGRDVVFNDGDPGVTITAGIVSTAGAVMEIWAPDSLNVPTQVGSITFSAGVAAAVLTWVSGTYTNPAGRVMTLKAPAVADITLADVTGYVPGEGL